jgi:hypothetical protein
MSSRGIATWLPILLWAFACSEVRIVPDGRGGAGDDDGSGAGHSSATGLDADACQTLCEASGPCLAKCGATCQYLQVPPCEDEGAAFVACLGERYDAATCTLDGCQAETDALLGCRKASPSSCGPESGGASDDFCSKSRECDTGQEKARCEPQDGVAQCTCYLSSVVVGTCTGPWSFEACNLEAGCCGSLL